jgi:hypothetical protein
LMAGMPGKNCFMQYRDVGWNPVELS